MKSSCCLSKSKHHIKALLLLLLLFLISTVKDRMGLKSTGRLFFCFMWQITVTIWISSLQLNTTSCQYTPSIICLQINPKKMLHASLNLWYGSGAPDSSHDELRLQVCLYVRFPHRILKVQIQRALAGHAAVAVAAPGLAVGQPLVGSTLVPPGLPAQTLLLHQQLQAFHLTACRTVFGLTHAVTWKRQQKNCQGFIY